MTEGLTIGASVPVQVSPDPDPSVTVKYHVSQIGNYLNTNNLGSHTAVRTSFFGNIVVLHAEGNTPGDQGGGFAIVRLLPSDAYRLAGVTSIVIPIIDSHVPDGLNSGVPIPDNPLSEIDPSVIDGARIMAEQTQLGAEHVDRWNRVLAAFGVLNHDNPMTAAEALVNIGKYNNAFWGVVAQELEKLEAARDAAGQQPQRSEQPIPTVPEPWTVPEPEPVPTPTVDPALVESVKALAAQTYHGEQHVERWNRVLAAFGVLDHNNPMTAAEALINTKRHSSPVWVEVAEVLRAFEAAQ